MNDTNAFCILVTGMFTAAVLLFISHHMNRSASALERIADALEGNEPDEEQDDDLEQ